MSEADNLLSEAVFGSYTDGLATYGPWLSFLFTNIIGRSFHFMDLIMDFEERNLNIARFNYAMITLIPISSTHSLK